MSSRGEEALGGLSLKDGAWPSEAECDGATTSSTRCLLKMRPVQVSSSFEPVATTTPFRLLSTGAGTGEFGAEAAGGGVLAGAEVPASARATLRWVTSSTNLFLFSALRTISAQEAQYVKVKSVYTQAKTSTHMISKGKEDWGVPMHFLRDSGKNSNLISSMVSNTAPQLRKELVGLPILRSQVLQTP